MRWWHLLLQSGHGFEESRISTEKQSVNTCTMESYELSENQVFELLKSPRRRYVLYHLRREERPVELSDLTNQVGHGNTTPHWQS
jgi:hypothetical protein